MDLLVIGGGAREHALIWKLRQSREVRKVYCSPGNGGISSSATLVPACAEGDWNSYADFVQRNNIGLTVVGPEVPLAGGIVNCFRKRGLKIFGPNQECARLESSKIVAKNFMKRHGIPTVQFQAFDNPADAFDFVSHLPPTTYHLPLVVKADGLAAGKGVVVCQTRGEAETVIQKLMVRKIFGQAGEKILIEELLLGEELSLMAFCDGKNLRALPPARDYKRVFDGDSGPNTGGMGALAPSIVSQESLEKINQLILQPFLKGIQTENLDYRGIIYFGLMLTQEGPSVLEFNVRFGDPETEVVLPLLQSDLLELFMAVIDQKLDKVHLEFSSDFCVGVVCASGGYPEKYEVHKEIFGLDKERDDLVIFHAGTLKENGKYYTNGGRVLTVVAKNKTLKEARKNSYGAVFKIEFNKMHYRNDIGK